jgi:hypothetical protein
MTNVIAFPAPSRPGLPAHLITACPATHHRVVAALEAADEAVCAGWHEYADRLIRLARAEVDAVQRRIAS